MIVIIAGSRPPKELRAASITRLRWPVASSFGDRELLEDWYTAHMPVLEKAIADSGFVIGKVVDGEAEGFDRLGRRWARRNGVPGIGMPADWRPGGVFDRAAGIKRNAEMAKIADAAIIVSINHSRGSEDMYQRMVKLKKPVFLVRLEE